MELGERLRIMRGSKTLQEMATICGLSVSYLSDLERGVADPSLKTLHILAEYHGVTVGDLANISTRSKEMRDAEFLLEALRVEDDIVATKIIADMLRRIPITIQITIGERSK